MKTKLTLHLLALTVLIASFAPSTASAFSDILAFGDSLTDNGPADGFGITTFSNGPVWVDYLANSSHLNLSLTDVACVGATTGTDNPYAGAYINPSLLYTGLNSQVDAYLALTGTHVSSTTLVTLWAGANDLFNGRSYSDAVTNMGTAIQKLEGAGAQNFLVLNLPNIGATPYFSVANPTQAPGATVWSQAFNAQLGAELTSLESQQPADHFYSFDTYSLLESIASDPAAYGVSSLADLYWASDPFQPGLHPSTVGHALIANAIYNQLESVPEPGTTALLFIGFALVARRRGIGR